MKLIQEKFKSLAIFSQGNCVLLGALTPTMIFSMVQQDKKEPTDQKADFEFGWSGLQLCCSHLQAYSYLDQLKEKNTGFMLEGAGYCSISQDLLFGFDKTKEKEFPCLEREDMVLITECISQLIGFQLQPEDRTAGCIIQLGAPNMAFPDTHLGLQVHAMVEVSEEAWTNLYQVHGQELEAAKKWYEVAKKKLAVNFLATGDLSSSRSLN